MCRATLRARTLAAALTVAMAIAIGVPALAQEGNTYRTTLTVAGAGLVVVCVTFSDETPGEMTILDPEGSTVMAVWGHWLKKKKWFLATSDQRGTVLGLTGKKAGAKKIKGDVVFTDDNEILQATFVGRLDPNCSVTRLR